MTRPEARRRLLLGAFIVTAVASMIVAGAASASRAPTKAERTSLRATTLAQCNKADGPCTWKSAVISTRNARFALSYANGSFIDYNVIYRRDSPTATRWRSRLLLSNGVSLCSVLLKAAPREVLRDLNIQGIKGSSTGYCGY